MTVAELKRDRLRKYLEAEAAILQSQEYQIGDRKFVRPSLESVRKKIQDLLDEGVTLEEDEIVKPRGGWARAVFED